MGPKDYDYMPAWERDFWDTLMEDQGVTFKSHVPAEDEYVSPYNTGDVLVGEIVEDEPLCITT